MCDARFYSLRITHHTSLKLLPAAKRAELFRLPHRAIIVADFFDELDAGRRDLFYHAVISLHPDARKEGELRWPGQHEGAIASRVAEDTGHGKIFDEVRTELVGCGLSTQRSGAGEIAVFSEPRLHARRANRFRLFLDLYLWRLELD